MPWSPEAPGGRPVRRSAARSVPGREVAPRWVRPARRSAPLERRLPAELRSAQPRERRHSARQPAEAGGPGGLAEWLVRSSSCPRQAAASVHRRAAAVPSSGFRRAVRLPAETRAESAEQAASSSPPAVAWRPLVAAGVREMASPSESKAAGSAKAAESAQPVASALRAQSPPAEAAGVACAQTAQPWAAVAGSDAWVRPPEEAVAASAAEPQQEVAAAVPGAGLLPGVVAAEPGAGLPPGVAEPARDAEVRRPVAAAGVLRDAAVVPRLAAVALPWARLPAAERPALASSVCRPGLPLPWPGPRRAVRTAHAMWKSRAALPSEQLWRVARCEGLS